MTPPSPPHSPGERPALRSLLPVPLLTAVLGAGAAGGAVALAPESLHVPLAGGAGAAVLLLTVTVAVAVHARWSAALLRQRLDAVSREARFLLQERARMAEEFGQERGRLAEESVQERARITADFGRERARIAAERERERERLSQERAKAAEERARSVEETEREKARLVERARPAQADGTAALAVTANVAGRMQALATGTLADLRAMEERHADEEVLADLLHLDHRTAQAGRLADSVAVLAGARSGRRWARPIPMESILRGAMGRIGAYRRIRLHSSCGSAVAGHAAEGVMHALAELLDNAANFSPPTAEVHVYVEEVPAGAIISVEDAGLVMSEVQLRRAERAVSGETAADITGLTGTRLGLAVVGRLAHKHGLRISFRPSARGGTGVLMLIPQDVLASTAPPPSTDPAAPAEGAPSTATGTRGRTGTAGRTEAAGAEGTPLTGFATEELYGGTARAPHDLDTGSSYVDSRAPYDLTAKPTPAPESPTIDALPRRRRGQSLADTERRDRAQSSEFRIPTLRSGDDASSGAVRFSSFRRAVRGTNGLDDQAFLQGTATGEEQDSTGADRTTPAEGLTETTAGATAGTTTSGELAGGKAEPVRGQEWDPEPVGGARWEPDPVRELTWGPTGQAHHPDTTDTTTPASAAPSASAPASAPAPYSSSSYPPHSSYAYPSYSSAPSSYSPSSPSSSSAYSSHAYGNPSADDSGTSPEAAPVTDAATSMEGDEETGTEVFRRPFLDLPSNAALGLLPSTDPAPYTRSAPPSVADSNPYLEPDVNAYSDPYTDTDTDTDTVSNSDANANADQHTPTHPHLEGGPTP